MRVCPHVNEMNIEKVLFNMTDVIAEDEELNNSGLFLSNRKNDAWENCSLILKEFDGGPTGHRQSHRHKIMINAHTFEIWCMFCNLEIFDLSSYQELAKDCKAEELPRHYPFKDVQPIRRLFMDKMQKEAGQGVFIDKKKSCNHLTSTLYLFANIEYVREVCSQLYLTSIEAINKQGRSFLPHLLHFFCRAVHHAASQTLDENMLDELLAAIAKYMTCSYAFSFTKFGHYLDDLLGHLNYYFKYLRWDKRVSELEVDTLTTKSKLNLYMDDQLVEESPLNTAFGGKYLIMRRCPNCSEMDIQYHDFLTIALQAFRGEDDTNHIYSIRKEFEVKPAAAAGGWGWLKPFGYFWASIWDVSMEDYITNHFKHDLVRKRDK